MTTAGPHETESGAQAQPAPTDTERPHGDPLAEQALGQRPEVADGEVVEGDEITEPPDKAAEYLALAQRTQADFENFRKRAARDAAGAVDRGIAKLAKELLPALDHLELALQQAESDSDSSHAEWAKGIRLIQSEFVAALGRAGIQPFSPVGETFDPSEHEAMAQREAEGFESGTVVEVYQQGYRVNGQVLRPARVIVAP